MAAKKAKKVEKGSKGDVESGKTLAAVSYLWIAGLIIMLTSKKNKFVMFHAKQATALFVVETIAGITVVLSPLAGLVGLVGLYGLVMALMGNETKIPLAYEFGEWIAKILKV
jgi:uncharacterized membrane protein